MVDSPSVRENGDRRWHMAGAWRAIGRIPAWEREIAIYKRDSGKVLDDETKIGTFLLRMPESQLKTHLLMRVDTLKKWTDFRGEVVSMSRAISAAQAQPTAMDIGAVGKGQSGKNGRGTKGGEKRNNQTQHACTRCGNTEHTSANCPHSDKTCQKCGKVGHFGPQQSKPKGHGKQSKGGKGTNSLSQNERAGVVVKVDICRHNARRKRCTQWMSRQRQ